MEQLRIKLKEGLTEPVIKSLLDDLRDKKVLGNEEIEEIVQKTKPRADQARDLIDGVSRKGTKASEIMLACLKNRDIYLYNSLNIDNHLAIPERGATCSPAPTAHSTTGTVTRNISNHIYFSFKDVITFPLSVQFYSLKKNHFFLKTCL